MFTTRVPNSNSEIDMYINIEAQNYYYPGYDLGNRAECYTSSLLMRQLNTLPSENKYDNLKKMYSIWICTSPPKKLKNKIILYKFHGEELTSLDCSKENKIYSNSLQNIIMIYLSNVYKEDKDKNNIINLLSLLFGELNFNKKEIINHLKNDYDIITLNKEAIDMCSLGEGIERRALDKGMQQGMQQGIQIGKYEYSINLINIGVPKEVIFEALKDEPDIIKKIKATLSNKNWLY